MNKGQSLHHSQSRVVYCNFFALWLLKHWKICITYRCSNFPRMGRKAKYRKKRKQKVMYSVALAMAFITAENENGLLEDLPKADSGHVSERFLLSVRTIVCFCSVSTHFFILSLGTNALYNFYSGIIYPFIFIP